MSSILNRQALISRHLSSNKAFSHYLHSTLGPCQKESHRVYTLQDAYLWRTPTTPPKIYHIDLSESMSRTSRTFFVGTVTRKYVQVMQDRPTDTMLHI